MTVSLERVTSGVVIDPLVTRLAGLVTPGGRALDCGTGRGHHALVLAAAGLAVDAYDRDAVMVEALREFAAAHDLAIDAFVADLATFEPDAGAYAAVIAINTIHFLPRDRAAAVLAGLRAAVAPGGWVAITAFAPTARLRAAMPRVIEAQAYLGADELAAGFAGWDLVATTADDAELDERGADGAPVIVHKVGVVARRPG